MDIYNSNIYNFYAISYNIYIHGLLGLKLIVINIYNII